MSTISDRKFIPSILSLFRQSLKLVDKNGELVFLVIPHGHDALKEKLSILLKEIEALFPGELRNTDSQAPGYEFLALHYTYYNRYHESVSELHKSLCTSYLYHRQGNGAPAGIHPDNLRKQGKLKINWMQREPRQSQDIKDHPEKYAVLKDILGDILEFIHDNVSFHNIARPDKALNAICRLNIICQMTMRSFSSHATFYPSVNAHLQRHSQVLSLTSTSPPPLTET